MSNDPEAALLAAVKTYLQITWTDEETDNRLSILIAAGKAYIDSLLNQEDGDYTEAGFARTLLMEYVRYGRDGALDVFENNYRSMILAMQHERMVNAYDAAQDAVSAPAAL